MAEEYLNASNGGHQSSFADQVLSHSANVVAVPNSYYIGSSQADAVPLSGPSLDYIDNSSFVHQEYQETVTIPSGSFVSIPENTNQHAFYNAGQGQQFFPGEISQGAPKGRTGESMDALTRSAFELLQGAAAQASNNNYNRASSSSADRNQLVSLLPSSSMSTGTTIVIGGQSNMMKTVGPSTSSIWSQAQQPRANIGIGSNQKIIRVLPQGSSLTSTTTPKTGNVQKYKCVLVKSSNGTEKNCIVMQPQTPAGLGNTTTQGQTASASIPRVAAAVRLANSVEQEISDMIRKTSAEFTIKGDDAKKSGLLEKTADKDATDSNGTAKFFCLFCKEKYAQKEGFQYHLQRISFVLKYRCTPCSTIFTFFNKCALWVHLSRHSESIDYERVLRLDPYDFVSNPNVFTHDMNASAVSDSKEIMNRMMSNTQGIVKCPICEEFVRNLPIHLKRPDGKSHAHFCHNCKMNLPNKCSLMAHLRLHRSGQQRLCCPECGVTREGLGVKDMFDHVDACMHFNRSESFSCECKATFPSLAEANKHFLETHMKPLSKCSSCSVTFTDPKLLESHLERNPQCKKQLSRTPARVTCLCTMCKSVLTTAIEAKIHLQKHVSNESQLSWMCFLCSMLFPTANELRIHCEEDHPHRAKRCTICYMLFCNRQLLVKHILNKNCTRDNHSLARCADMPLKALIDIDNVVKTLYKIPASSKSQAGSSSSASQGQGQNTQRKSAPSLNFAALGQEKQAQSSLPKQYGSSQEKDSGLMEEAEQSSPTPAAPLKQKVAIRKPGNLEKTQSALLADLQHWIVRNGKEIVPTTTPPSKKRGRPKKEKQPPPNLVCGVSAKGISYQCHQCKIIVTGTNNFMSHMKYHEARGDCVYGAFSHCSVCDKLVGSHLITKHLKVHQDQGVIVCCRCQRRDFGDMEDAVQHAHNLCEYRKIGEIPAAPLPTQENNVRTFTVSNVDQISVPRQTEPPVQDHSDSVTQDLAQESSSITAAPQAKNKLYPCHLCGLVFENVVLRDQHVRKSHGGTRKSYHCLVCEKKKVMKTFANQFTARKHVTNKHRIVQPNMVDKCLKEVISSVSSNVGQAKVISSEQQEEVSVDGPAPKRLRLAGDGEFMCAKCGFSCQSNDKVSFSKHIRTHNVKQEPQCPECGLCFTVLNAIKRHLFAVHKIKDIDSYLAENGIEDEQEEEEDEFASVLEEMLPGVRPLPPVTRQQQAPSAQTEKEQGDDDLDSLECNVCYRSFDTETNLKTHMRTHGMAFIRSKRYKPI